MKTLFLTIVAALAISGTARAQEPKAHDHEHVQPPAVADQKADQKRPMMGMAAMRESMQANDKRLDDLVAQLNAAKGNDRIDKLVAVINELVTEHKSMHVHMREMMKEAVRAAIFYATREGQAERVAERVASDLRAQHAVVDVIDVKDVRGSIEWGVYDQAFVVASVHAGHHEKEMIAFVKRSKDELARLHAPFLSLTLSQAGAELPSNTLLQRQTAHEDALRMIYDFVRETGWQPARVLPVAGALIYSKYNFLMKFIMKHIAHKAGFDGPTSRDYEFTNWPEVDRFVAELPIAA